MRPSSCKKRSINSALWRLPLLQARSSSRSPSRLAISPRRMRRPSSSVQITSGSGSPNGASIQRFRAVISESPVGALLAQSRPATCPGPVAPRLLPDCSRGHIAGHAVLVHRIGDSRLAGGWRAGTTTTSRAEAPEVVVGEVGRQAESTGAAASVSHGDPTHSRHAKPLRARQRSTHPRSLTRRAHTHADGLAAPAGQTSRRKRPRTRALAEEVPARIAAGLPVSVASCCTERRVVGQ